MRQRRNRSPRMHSCSRRQATAALCARAKCSAPPRPRPSRNPAAGAGSLQPRSRPSWPSPLACGSRSDHLRRRQRTSRPNAPVPCRPLPEVGARRPPPARRRRSSGNPRRHPQHRRSPELPRPRAPQPPETRQGSALARRPAWISLQASLPRFPPRPYPARSRHPSPHRPEAGPPRKHGSRRSSTQPKTSARSERPTLLRLNS